MTTIYLCDRHNMATVVGPADASSCEVCLLFREASRVEELELAIRNYRDARNDLAGGATAQIDAVSSAYMALLASLNEGGDT